MTDAPSVGPAADLLRIAAANVLQTPNRATAHGATPNGESINARRLGHAPGAAPQPETRNFESLFTSLLTAADHAEPAAAPPVLAASALNAEDNAPHAELQFFVAHETLFDASPSEIESVSADTPEHPGTGPPNGPGNHRALLPKMTAGGTIVPPGGVIVPHEPPAAADPSILDRTNLEVTGGQPAGVNAAVDGRSPGSATTPSTASATGLPASVEKQPALDLSLTDGNHARDAESQLPADRPAEGRQASTNGETTSTAERGTSLDGRLGLPATAAHKPPTLDLQRLPQAIDVVLANDRTVWPEQMANRLALLVQRETNTASLRLHPPSLGRVDVKITISNDQAAIWLSAPIADVRDMLGQSLVRLDNLLANAGIELTGAEVGGGELDRDMEADDPGRPTRAGPEPNVHR